MMLYEGTGFPHLLEAKWVTEFPFSCNSEIHGTAFLSE
jgi:hypothetical protein